MSRVKNKGSSRPWPLSPTASPPAPAPRFIQVHDGWAPAHRWDPAIDPGAPLPLHRDMAAGLQFGVRAAAAAHQRVHDASNQMRAEDAWAAAVESTWWLTALEERLVEVWTPAVMHKIPFPPLSPLWGGRPWDRYRAMRRLDGGGRVMDGLLWLRHRHAHEMAMTGKGSARPFFGPHDNPGTLFYISAGYTWRPADDVPHNPDGDLSPWLRSHYEVMVAGRQLHEPLGAVLGWLDRLMWALGLPAVGSLPDKDRDPRDLP